MKNLRKGWAVCSLENMRGCVTWQVKAKFSIILGVERYVSILIFLHRRTLDLCVSVSLIFSWLLILMSATYFLIFHSVNLLDYNIFIKTLPNIYLWFVPHTPFFSNMLLLCHYFCLPQPPYNFPVPECVVCWESRFWRKSVSVWIQDLPRDFPLLVWPGYRSQRLDWRMD